MKIYFGNDHAAYEQRAGLLAWLRGQGHDVVDLGWDSPERADYPDFAQAVGRATVADPGSFGVLICGSGIGMSIAANKVAGVRAALALDTYSAEMSRRHNNANVVCLRAREQSLVDNEQILATFLEAPFEGGRHAQRVDKIELGGAC